MFGFSRLDAQETWARSLTPPADSSGGNKRPADRCEFYSTGWCINGGSCRFLHVREPVISRNKDGFLDTAKMKNKLINGEGNIKLVYWNWLNLALVLHSLALLILIPDKVTSVL